MGWPTGLREYCVELTLEGAAKKTNFVSGGSNAVSWADSIYLYVHSLNYAIVYLIYLVMPTPLPYCAFLSMQSAPFAMIS